MKSCRLLVLCFAVLFGTWSVLAETPPQRERPRPDAPRHLLPQQRDVAPLLVPVPENAGNGVEVLILRGVRVLARETFTLTATPKGATLDVLATHATELARLRGMEATEPGLTLVIAREGNALANLPFADADRDASNFALRTAAGVPQRVEMFLDQRDRKAPSVTGMEPDPECAAGCDQQYFTCLDWCDPRGSSCQICYEQQTSCYQQCPQICVEPKRVYTYDNWSLQATYLVGYNCFFYSYWDPDYFTGDLYAEVERVWLVSRYQRTEHCDGSYTDVLQTQFTLYEICNVLYFPYGCFYPDDYPWNQC